MNFIKKVYYSDKALHRAQGITIGLTMAFLLIQLREYIK